MIKLETVNELTLKATSDGNGQDVLFTKAGAFIAGENYGPKNYVFEKLLIGPSNNIVQNLIGSISRRVTGENLPLMKVTMKGPSITYYANDQQHVVVYKLKSGETISVESENILAFTPDCKYSVRFLGCGVVSQKGLATSTLTCQGPNAYAAVLVDGNPIVISNMQNGSTMEVDPDAVVCWVGADPGFKMDLSWKNLIGQASGESYMFEWGQGRNATVIIQPQERKSGINIGMDGGSSGQRASRQQNQTLGQAGQSIGNTLNQLGGMLGGGGGGNLGGGGGLGGLGGLM